MSGDSPETNWCVFLVTIQVYGIFLKVEFQITLKFIDFPPKCYILYLFYLQTSLFDFQFQEGEQGLL